MNRIPFDCDALRQYADTWLVVSEDDDYLLISRVLWDTFRADLLAAADEIELLMAERVKETAA